MSVAQPIAPQAPLSAPHQQTLFPVISQSERADRLRLARSRNVGPRTYHHLLTRFGSAERALEALPDLAARGGNREYELCSRDAIDAEISVGQNLGCTLLMADEPGFPELLRALDPIPPMIWVLGNVDLLSESAVALVGARNASALGIRTAKRLARELGVNGHVIVSGLARGIDAAAHEAALQTGTIAVLAGGLDKPYPPENAGLYERIAAEGALISEVAFGVEPTTRHFPRRNRLISGLSQGVVLIEAAARSGSLITARFALEQGREVMACPGAAEDPRAAGCNMLIRDGAALIRHAGDVDDALSGPTTFGLAEGGTDFEFDADKREKRKAFLARAKLMEIDGEVERVWQEFNDLEDFARKVQQAVAKLATQLAEKPAPNSPAQTTEAAITEDIVGLEPPLLRALPSYAASHSFVGRAAELKALDKWAHPEGKDPVLLFEAMGGSGKSMLVDLLCALRSPDTGRIEIDGVDARELRLDSLRENLFCIREPEVFSGSVFENLQVARHTATTEEMTAALDRVGLLGEVRALPDGIDTRLSTDGVPLSRSQMARLMFARAFVAAPSFVAIDGELPFVEGEAREELLNALFDEERAFTLLVVSDRPDVLERCDRVVELTNPRRPRLLSNDSTTSDLHEGSHG